MALKLNFTKEKIYYYAEDDFIKKTKEYKNAYFKIDKINGTKENIKLIVGIYENAEKENLIENKLYEFTPSVKEKAENFIQQGYEYLKSLEEFTGAEDC